MSKEFHITIMPYPPTPKGLNINKEINLIKKAFLYVGIGVRIHNFT